MRILVTAASKHGSTWEIAEKIAQVLSEEGNAVKLVKIKDIHGISGYHAVVLGSGVYAGRWLAEARAFVDKHQAELSEKPTWIFSSGPIGSPLSPPEDKVVQINDILTMTKAKDHFIFAGCLKRDGLSFFEKAITRSLKVQFGDYRDWEDITACAKSIAESLRLAYNPDPAAGYKRATLVH